MKKCDAHFVLRGNQQGFTLMKKYQASHFVLRGSQQGFTLIETLLVMGILGLLFGIGLLSIGNIQVVTQNTASSSVIISDLKTQQIKAMVGDTEGRGVPDNYGIKILSDRYILFHGMTYSATDTANFSIPIASGYTLASTFPSTTILFASNSGELVNFSQGQDTITVTHTASSKQQIIRLNKYGTITNLQ
jgi:prepilin-type N-terminal cleavage/methylation domain-containing protein